ncbi:DUF4232 domain-containing protein [Arthrobacter sp. UKPF54-2]|uniref:DUF4232 domain-containing protein n=1 Tax=Arthrobacter sp. UKPF54-2 TaxID=2600159 RepID=UPI00164684F4|nr:DUF4232 domain-containing protein [Arthrobacter sp. UKPF54-2]
MVPETVVATAWRAVMPWPLAIPVLSVLTLLGVLLLLLRFAVPRATADRPGAQPGSRADLMSVWLCVVLASFLTSALWSAGSILAQWPPPRAAMLFDAAGTALLSAGYWGIVWGWVPAVAWVRVARRAPHGQGTVPDAVPRRLPAGAPVAATAVVAMLLVAAAPLSGSATRAASLAQARPAPAPSPTPPPVVYGSPTVGPSLQAADPAWCRSEQVRITLGEPDAATGHRGMPLRLLNTGGTPCVLNAYPDVAFNDTAGWAMDILAVHGGSFMTTDRGPSPVTVAPGATAEAFLGWNAMAGAGDTRVGTILVAPFAGVPRTSLPADLDMVSGGYVAVTAWSLAKPAA